MVYQPIENLSKTQLSKIGQSGGFLGRPVEPLAKSFLMPFGLTVAASATDAAIQKIFFRSALTTLIIRNEEMDDYVKIVKSLEEFGLLLTGVSQTI